EDQRWSVSASLEGDRRAVARAHGFGGAHHGLLLGRTRSCLADTSSRSRANSGDLRAPRVIDPSMAMRSFRPSSALAPHVRELMAVDVAEETARVRLPEPGLVLALRHRGAACVVVGAEETRLPMASLAGVTNVARRMRTSAGGNVVLALFHPGGAAHFF